MDPTQRSTPPRSLGPVRDLPLRPRNDPFSKPLPPLPPSSPSETDETEDQQGENGRSGESRLLNFRPSMSPEPVESPPERDEPILGTPVYQPTPGRHRPPAESDPELPTTPLHKLAALTIETRNRSPYGRSRFHGTSSQNSLSSPGFAPRSKSLPYSELGRPSSPLLRPASPFSNAHRRVSPLRRPFEDSYSFSGVDIDQTIAENSALELDLKPRPVLSIDSADSSGNTPTTPNSPFMSHGTFPRTRRRPSSPLHVLHSPGYSRLHASASSPTLRSPMPSPVDPAKYNESYPAPVTGGGGGGAMERAPPPLPHAATIATGPPYYATSTLSAPSISSMPSTPSSFRSRSPSISSLETIPDSPDAEAAAAAQTARESDALARLRAASEKRGGGGGSGDDGARVRGRTMGRTSDGAGFGGGGGAVAAAKERKRWSVSGAERRGDLEMETIWED